MSPKINTASGPIFLIMLSVSISIFDIALILFLFAFSKIKSGFLKFKSLKKYYLGLDHNFVPYVK